MQYFVTAVGIDDFDSGDLGAGAAAFGNQAGDAGVVLEIHAGFGGFVGQS